MDFEWTPQQRALHARFREAGHRFPPADQTERDDSGRLWHATWRGLADEGVMALPVPEVYGGLGCDAVTCAFALEGLGYGSRDTGLLFSAGAHLWAVEMPVLKFGTQWQQEKYLPGLASGQLIGAHAITEPNAGSDALGLEMTASRKGKGYVLSGRKRFTTNAPVADVFLVYATIDKRLGFTGVTAFLVDKDQPGLSVVAEKEKIGLRTAPWGQLVFDECVIEESQRLGSEKQGSRIFATAMSWERALLLAPILGTMARQTEECIEYVKDRKQFGRRIASFQSVQNKIVNMQVLLENARLVTYRAAWDLAEGNESIFSEIAKLQVSEAAITIFANAMEVFGGDGYTVNAGIDRNLRDALGSRMSSGTSDMQKVVIAARLGVR